MEGHDKGVGASQASEASEASGVREESSGGTGRLAELSRLPWGLIGLLGTVLILCALVAAGCAPSRIDAPCASAPGVGPACPDATPAGLARVQTVDVLFRHLSHGDAEAPGPMVHAEILLPDGTLRGFYAADGTDAGSAGQRRILAQKGVVADTAWIRENRPQYVDATVARAWTKKGQSRPILTTRLRIPATPAKVRGLEAAWRRLAAADPHFRSIGNNCTTKAAESLIEAGILRGSIFGGLPGIDRPSRLYNELREQYGGTALQREVGYFTLTPDGRGVLAQ